ITEKISPLGDQLKDNWWFYSTVAEAHFGLGEYKAAVEWLKRGQETVEKVDEWEYETTLRQLASLASRQTGPGQSGEDFQDTPQWKALREFFGNDAAPVRSAFLGKIGLGLSGGGFRASLFHLGVFARLAELDVLRHVEVLSCVSGGSIVGAHYYLEVRNLLQSKPDAEITREDYIELVKRLEKNFLAGVQRNIRVRVAAELATNLKMIFVKNYSRTLRAGELYEREIYSLVADGEGDRPRYMDDLNIHPQGEAANFSPKKHNWRRAAKAPILILNAAVLNTGHTWQFTTSWMGEPPAGIDSEIDGNDRLRRMYYEDAPAGRRRVRLGHAVSASACVPGLFEPLALDQLYPERTVLMVDGGVCDNQGVGGLLEQDCTVALISDGSGQMESKKEPSAGLLGVPLRSNTILQARIRAAQFHELNARRRSGLLRGLMFVHLKSDLDVDPVDWIDCPDPFDASDDARPAYRRGRLTRYGIAKTVQARLAAVRTDLDSFSDAEAYALMTSGYRMTERAFRDEKCVTGFKEPGGSVEWDFLAVEEAMKEPGKAQTELMTLLKVSDRLAFKIWKLSSVLKIVAWVVGLAALAALAFLAWRYWPMANKILAGLGVALVSVVAVVLLFLAVGKLFAPVGRVKNLLTKILIGVVSVIGFAAARLHLHVFDKMFLRRGSLETLKRRGAS
ncbi:MAG TPA: patatin-like phospholipase family protein, partial [Pyrinomonadaceae bacterium]|nr:patatin-like phospholipase family protein [Pyrinomonadaceae bacterium]